MSGYSWEKLKSEHRKNANKLGLKFGNFGWVGTKDSILSKTDKGYFGTTYVGPGKYKNEFETYESIRKNGSKLMKKKTRKKVIRRKRRSMTEKRVMRLKRGLKKRARKLRLGAKRTGAYVYGTLRRIVGNPGRFIPNVGERYDGGLAGGPFVVTQVRKTRLSGDPIIRVKFDSGEADEDYASEIQSWFKRGGIGLRRNPPMYAHRMMSHRTHGLSLRQMMKLYRLVSSGNPKAVMYARRTLGIPMSESLSQVKAVVYHHVLDLKGKI